MKIKDTFLAKSKFDRWTTVLLMLCIVTTILFIFSNSAADVEASTAQSTQMKDVVEPVIEPIVGKGNVTEHLVRKLAHLAEFGILGFELALLLRKWFLPSFFLTLLVAVADETLQIYSHRGSLLTDVWLDFFGACIGFTVGIGFVALVRYCIKSYQRKKVTE